MDIKKLKEVFSPDDIEWRVSRAGQTNGKVWAFVLAYITNRAIMNRLDDVCGPENWKNEFAAAPNGGTLCGISIKINNEWVTKWDGADNTEFEAVKGGLSGSMKRAAVQWGIGRYLYNLSETYAVITENGKHYQSANQKKGTPAFKWDEPQLPLWALPEGFKYAQQKGTSERYAQKKPETDKPKSELSAVMGDVITMIKNSGFDDDTMASLRNTYAGIKTIEQAKSFKTEVKKLLTIQKKFVDDFKDDPIPFDDSDIPFDLSDMPGGR